MLNKLVAIVGMGGGISYAVAQRFAREGYTIAMIARNETTLQGFQKDLLAQGYPVHYALGDAANETSLKTAFETLHQVVGDPEVLVYNAAALRMKNIVQDSYTALVDDFRVNVAGALVATQMVLPAMQTNHRGTLLFTGGGLALYPTANLASLAIGKAGIRVLAQTLHETLQPQGIRVATVTICGYVKPGDAKYSPERIAEQYWQFHQGESTEREIMY